jgi:hypothetical protein
MDTADMVFRLRVFAQRGVRFCKELMQEVSRLLPFLLEKRREPLEQLSRARLLPCACVALHELASYAPARVRLQLGQKRLGFGEQRQRVLWGLRLHQRRCQSDQPVRAFGQLSSRTHSVGRLAQQGARLRRCATLQLATGSGIQRVGAAQRVAHLRECLVAQRELATRIRLVRERLKHHSLSGGVLDSTRYCERLL